MNKEIEEEIQCRCGYRGPTFKELVSALDNANLWNSDLQEEYQSCFRTNPCLFCGAISFKNGFKRDHHNLAFLMDLAIENNVLKHTGNDPNKFKYVLVEPCPHKRTETIDFSFFTGKVYIRCVDCGMVLKGA